MAQTNHTRRTLCLNKKWDVTLDTSGNIKITEGALATAQNVANEARLFINDAYFAQDIGTPYFSLNLGQRPNNAITRANLNASAQRVLDVKEVQTIRINTTEELATRTLKGDIQFTTKEDTENVSVNVDI